jgi:guanylate kinase
VFVDEATFEAKREAGGFLEWARFLDHLYGTPTPDAPPGCDVLLEIDLQGAEQVKAVHPEAVVILLLPPSPAVQEARLRARGDDEEHVARRLAKAHDEEALGRQLAEHIVVNGDLERTVAEVAGIVEAHRTAGRA